MWGSSSINYLRYLAECVFPGILHNVHTRSKLKYGGYVCSFVAVDEYTVISGFIVHEGKYNHSLVGVSIWLIGYPGFY